MNGDCSKDFIYFQVFKEEKWFASSVGQSRHKWELKEKKSWLKDFRILEEFKKSLITKWALLENTEMFITERAEI